MRIQSKRIQTISLVFAGMLFQEGVGQQNPLEEALRAFQAGQYSRTQKLAERILEASPDAKQTEEALILLGNSQFVQERYSEAEVSFQRLFDQRGKYAVTGLRSLMKVHLASHAWGKASRTARSLLEHRDRPEVQKELENFSASVFNEALREFDQGGFERAKDHAESVLSVGFHSEAMILKGLCLLKLSESEKARAVFVSVLKEKIDPENRKAVEDFLDQIRRGVWEGRKNYWIDGAWEAGFRSNIYSDGESETPSSKMGQVLSLSGGCHLGQGRPVSLLLENGFFWDETVGVPELRNLRENIRVAGILDYRSWSLRLGPALSLQWLGSSLAIVSPDLDIRSQLNFGRFELGFEFYAAWKNATQPEVSFLSGVFEQRHIFLAYHHPLWTLGFYLFDQRDAIGDYRLGTALLPLAHSARGQGVRWSFVPTENWEVELGFTYFFRNYLNPSLPSGTDRQDREKQILAGVAYRVSQNISFTSHLELIWNTSTLGSSELDDKNFFGWSGFGGIKWQMLR